MIKTAWKDRIIYLEECGGAVLTSMNESLDTVREGIRGRSLEEARRRFPEITAEDFLAVTAWEQSGAADALAQLQKRHAAFVKKWF